MAAPLYTPDHIKTLEPYKAGKSLEQIARELKLAFVAKLSSNENPLGPSPKAIAAVNAHLSEMHRYPDPATPALSKALSNLHRLETNRFIFTYGADALLNYALIAFSGEGDEVLSSECSFIGIFIHAQKLGRRINKIPLLDWGHDYRRILKSIGPRTRIVYLASPNNPTGRYINASDLKQFLNELPSHILLILDEAYAEYAQSFDDYTSGIELMQNNTLPANVLIARTFSKAYGLAGFRIGYGVSHPDIIQQLYKVRLPFEPTRIAQVAAAAAVEDLDFLRETLALNQRGMRLFQDTFTQLNLQFERRSAGNSYLIWFAGAEKAGQFFQAALSRGLVTRPLNAFGVPNGIRINTGTDRENKFAVDIMNQLLGDNT